MQYVTIVADSYERAVEEAEKKYGNGVRIHSRREFTVGGGLFRKKRKKCELVCYLVPKTEDKPEKPTVTKKDLQEFEQEAKTPDPSTLTEEERLDTRRPAQAIADLEEVERILSLNSIGLRLRDHILDGFDAGEDLYLTLSDKIVSSVSIDHERQARPGKYLVFIGPTGSGKTTTLAKMASLYKTVGKDVGIISLDSYRLGAFDQVKAFADAFDIPSVLVTDEDAVLLAQDQMKDKDLVMVDTMGLSPDDIALNLKLKGLLSLFPAKDSAFLLTTPANIKTEDMLRQYRHYMGQIRKIDSLIITKLDETESIGSALTLSYEVDKPIAFCTNGQGVPDDLKKASTLVLMEYLKGFNKDFKAIIGQLT